MPCAECHFGVYHDVKSGGGHILMERGVDHACVIDHYRPEIMFFPFGVPVLALHERRLDVESDRNRESCECLSRNAVGICAFGTDVGCQAGDVGFKRLKPGVGHESRCQVCDVGGAGRDIDPHRIVVVHFFPLMSLYTFRPCPKRVMPTIA